MQQIAVPGVVHRQQQPEYSVPVAGATGDVVSEGRRITGAAANGGGEGAVEAVGVEGGAEAGDQGEEEHERDECGGEEREEPFLFSSHGDHE